MKILLRERVRTFGRHLRRYFDRMYKGRSLEEDTVPQIQTIESATSEMQSSADHAQRVAKMITNKVDKRNNAELLSEMLERLDKK